MALNSPSSQPSVRALERGLDILECFRGAEDRLPLTAIASAVKLPPSTALRILATLEKRGYLVRGADSRLYSLGPNALRFGGQGGAMEILPVVALSAMRELNAMYDESISIYVAMGNKRVCIQRVESTRPLRQVINIGDALSLTVGAGGKVLAAWLDVSPNHDVSRLVPALPPQLLAEVREAGYAVSFGEREVGTYAIAAPIFGHRGHILGALSLSGPIARFDAQKLPDMAAKIMEKARHLSSLMGNQ
ncbi:MAG: IclR family transcriptional regulator [Candidatus Accumulibacter sp.]|jgi:DNA-binding IclR family transcriptional regulator|nr:IclR family transcriptional regulator [Accumulibacter sp.]